METKTHWKKLLINLNYLGCYSLEPGKDMILTIDKVVKEEVKGSTGETDTCTVCYFKENVKPMIFNRVNQKIIARIYHSPYIEDWFGKKIQIYADNNIKAFGEIVEGLRVRPFEPKTTKPALELNTPAFTKAMEYMKSEGASIDKIKNRYSVSTEVEKELEKAKEVVNA